MPVYVLRPAEPQKEREELERGLDREVRECTEVTSTVRNYVKRFLMEYDVWHLSEIDYPLRLAFEDYAYTHKLPSVAPLTCLHTFDKMKLHAMREEMRTMAGRRKYGFKYADKVIFLTYDAKIEIAEQLVKANDKVGLVWDFTKPCGRKLKEQIFVCLEYVIGAYKDWERRKKLRVLQLLYEYCAWAEIVDIELMTLEQEKQFIEFLEKKLSGIRLEGMYKIIELCRKILFLQADQIHWHAQVWYLKRFHFSKERMNPSKMVGSISFREITQEENKKYLKEYMRYALGITDIP